MNGVVRWFIRYPIWSNVLMLVVFIAGLLSLSGMRSSFFPETRPDTISIQVPYPGASPVEVEEAILSRIEESLEGLDGVDRINATAAEGMAAITVELIKNTDHDVALSDIKNAVDQITALPEDAEKPVITRARFRGRSVSVLLYGPDDRETLKYIAEDFRDRLLLEPGLSQVTISGVPEREISVEVREESLRRYGITFQDVSRAVNSANLNLSGGKLETPAEEFRIRAWGQSYDLRELERIPVRGSGNGSVVRLMDVAQVVERWEDSPERTWFQGTPAIQLDIDKTFSEDILGIAAATYRIVEEFNDRGTPVQAEVTDDRTIHLRQRIDLLMKNGVIGLLLVLASLWFFINLRLSFWVALGIPFSFCGMFIIASQIPITINVISLFGMIIVVGILVDDAIVVAENIYAHAEKGAPPIQAAVKGTIEMLGPVCTSVTTTIVAFTPFFFLDGFMGKIIWQVAVVVIASLFFSLIEAFLILPAHLAHSKGLDRQERQHPVRERIEKFVEYITHRVYAPLLRASLRNKLIVLSMPIAAFLIVIGLMRGGHVGMTFFPFIDGDSFPVNLSLASGSQEDRTLAELLRIEQAVWEVNEEIAAERPDSLRVITGVIRSLGSNGLGDRGGHAGMLDVQLQPGEIREMDSFLISNRLREKVGSIVGARQLTYGRTGRFGKPVSIALLGRSMEQLQEARDLVVESLQAYPELKDITDSNQEGNRELSITLTPLAESLGFTLRDVTSQVRQGFYGLQSQRLQRGRDELRVWVRYADSERQGLGQLKSMRIQGADGSSYPLADLAELEYRKGVISISHLDGKRQILVEANLSDEEINLPPLLARIQGEILPLVQSRTQGVQVSFEGQSRQQRKETTSMRNTFLFALFVMFVLMVLVFRSWGQALLIFSLIPLGLIGVVVGHGIHDVQVNILSLYGIIALTGIIVNDSIVLVDQINRNLKAGMHVDKAAFEAGIARLRPILLTTFTTSLGLAPLILETSRQAQFLIPMAISVAWGLVFATAIMLLVLPAGFLVLNRLRLFAGRLRDKNLGTEDVEPAILELRQKEVA